MKYTAVITIFYLFNGSLLFCRHLWWVDLGWAPGAHQAARSLPFPVEQGRENQMKSNLQFGIKHFTKAKVKVQVHVSKEEKKSILYFPTAGDGQQLPGNQGFKSQWLLQKASVVDNGFPPTFPFLQLLYLSDVIWYGTALWRIWVSWHGCVFSQDLPPPIPSIEGEC